MGIKLNQKDGSVLYTFDVRSTARLAIQLQYDINISPHHHHQPINVPTAGAQAFLV
jgi:hypothetical protein